MKLFELTFQYHDKLNPKLWDGQKLKPEVLKKLREIGDHFFDSIDIPDLNVIDMVITGSCANFNYTSFSDIDLHLIVKRGERCQELTAELFDSKKEVWADKYDISIYGFPVELYVQDSEEPHVASGVYSIKDNKWIKKPEYDPPKVNKKDIHTISTELKNRINKVVSSDISIDKAKALKDEIKNTRNKGLKNKGEYDDANLTFKELRNTGMIGKLIKFIRDKETEELSLK